ncbi:hypothetical protein CYMTET_53440 [Cymbomonas tetramitiformis]|uniref:Uncharacterized protein n=1 Tax=Cymbomonas tetramitiformis TaxID=36881 RepID=A0AAE0BH77_9CHLO|nr:hypothetical protein CYMTET_53440 [Cymbomonas tetramitiformis]
MVWVKPSQRLVRYRCWLDAERRPCGGEGDSSGCLVELEWWTGGDGLEQAVAEAADAERPGNAGAKENVAAALWNLSGGDGLEQAIAEAGAIPPLVELLRDDSADAKKNVAAALWNLSGGDGLEQAIAEAGAMPLLVELLRDSNAEAKKNAAAAPCGT